jgi:hypothetical protein
MAGGAALKASKQGITTLAVTLAWFFFNGATLMSCLVVALSMRDTTHTHTPLDGHSQKNANIDNTLSALLPSFLPLLPSFLPLLPSFLPLLSNTLSALLPSFLPLLSNTCSTDTLSALLPSFLPLLPSFLPLLPSFLPLLSNTLSALLPSFLPLLSNTCSTDTLSALLPSFLPLLPSFLPLLSNTCSIRAPPHFRTFVDSELTQNIVTDPPRRYAGCMSNINKWLFYQVRTGTPLHST